MYLLSFFVFMVLCIGFLTLSTGGNIVYFIDMPSLVLLILIVVPMLMSAGLLKDFNNAFRLGIKVKKPAKKAELVRAIEAVSFTIKVLWAGAIFCTVFQLVTVVVEHTDDYAVLFACSAISLVPLSYATFLALLLLPLQSRLKVRLNALCEENVNIEENGGEEQERSIGENERNV